jgi:hypothetical protein
MLTFAERATDRRCFNLAESRLVFKPKKPAGTSNWTNARLSCNFSKEKEDSPDYTGTYLFSVRPRDRVEPVNA